MNSSDLKIIEVEHLSKHFGRLKALEDVSFEVYQGDVFGFLGPNGAGKSTTIRCILSLITPTDGKVKLFGRDLAHNRAYILSRIGCMVEKPDFYKFLSAKKNLEIFARISGKEVKGKRISEILEFVGLKGRENDKLSGYSHGMRQRLGIAQTLVHDPELIILDEPTTGLDPQGIIDIRNLILDLKNVYNKTVLLSSHLLSEIELIANRVVIISRGKTLVKGSVKELLNSQELVVCFSVDEPEKAKSIAIGFTNDPDGANVEGSGLYLRLSEKDVPTLNDLFCKQEIKVYSIESKRKLEDYFLKLVAQ